MDHYYDHPDVYDVFYNRAKEPMLRDHYQRVLAHKAISTIHDCSFGSGNLSLVLAEMGYRLSGSDINQKMLDAASKKATARNLDIPLYQCDFRTLTSLHLTPVECIMCTGNSLGHVPNSDVALTLQQMASCVKSGGYLYLDSRNWDTILQHKKRFHTFNPILREDDRVNVVQVWDYLPLNTITFTFLFTYERDARIYRREEFTETYHPVTLGFIEETLQQCGFSQIEVTSFIFHQITDFAQMPWYCLIARKD
jgi:SAM-dependent methyltransferase